MNIIIQRVKKAHVIVDETIVGKIDKGFMLLVGLVQDDTVKDLEKAADKIVSMRIFEDEEEKMNRDIKDMDGSILSVSQFTLAADVRKGNRPSFIEAMRPDQAKEMFETFNEMLRNRGVHVETGVFQAHMNVVLDNDGPVTIILEVKDGKVV